MIEFDAYHAITALSGLVIVSYIFTVISARTRIPTVLMLLLLGVGIREFLVKVDRYIEIPLDFVQFLGVLGLILILLEAGLDLNLSREKAPLVRRATGSALFVLALSVVGIAAIIYFLLDQGLRTSLVYAVPLAVISSTIVASSINYLSEEKREFLTYESSLSDIFGILLFNVLIAEQSVSVSMIAFNVGSIVLAIVISVVVSVGLVFLLAKVKLNIKAFLILPVLLLIYSVGHLLQLPTLLTVLIFGLILNNWRLRRFHHLHRYLGIGAVEDAAKTVKAVNTESAFLIRTLFFVFFGYMIDVRVLGEWQVIAVGSAIVAAIFAVRYLYLRIFLPRHILPELFFAPRGLVTIVLFYSIPASMTINAFDDGIVFFVVMVSTLIMTVGSLWFTPQGATRVADDERNAENERIRAEQAKNADGERQPFDAPTGPGTVDGVTAEDDAAESNAPKIDTAASNGVIEATGDGATSAVGDQVRANDADEPVPAAARHRK